MIVLLRHLLTAGLALVMAGTAAAQSQAPKPTSAPSRNLEAGGPSWATLTPAQRQALAPLERDWPGIDAAQKSKWLELSSRYKSMPADEQQRVQARMSQWARLTPSERGQARWSFVETQQLSREQKQQRWEAYQALSDEERKALAARARPIETRQPASAPAGPAPAKPPGKPVALPSSPASKPSVNPVAPTIVQARPGATTTLMTRTVVPPAHQQVGQPRIAAKPGQVDSQTLLPKSGPQAAASAPRTP